MWRLPSIVLLGIALSVANGGVARAAETQYDGLWKGELSGRARMTGIAPGDYRISGRVQGTNLKKGRMIGTVMFGLKGGFSGDTARGEVEFHNCGGQWEATLVEQAAPTVAEAEPIPVAEPEPDVSEPSEPRVAGVPDTPDAAIATPPKKPARATQEPAVATQSAERDRTPPTIAVPSIVAVDGETIDLTGIVRDDSAILDLRVDGRAVEMDQDGRFRLSQPVAVGTNTLTITALDEWGNESRRLVEVTRAAPTAPAPAPTENTATAGTGDDTEPPVITTPPSLKTDQPAVGLIGRVNDASTIVQFMINDRPVPLGPDGRFHVERTVPLGESAFRLSAVDEWGNQAEIRVDVARNELVVETGRYFALVIGNNDYDAMPTLKTAIADAEAISEVLTQRYGFAVTQLHNATRYDVLKALSTFRKELSYEDNLLIYYAGHGVVDPVTERGYWLPVDAEESLQANWISNADIADSCYSGILTRDVPVQLETFEDRRA